MNASELLNSVDRTALLDFYNESFEPRITREKLDNQIAIFNQEIKIKSDMLLRLTDDGGLVALGVATEDDVSDPAQVGSTIEFAIDFSPWGEILAMEIDPEMFETYRDECIATFIFEEMIWHGWTVEDRINNRDLVTDHHTALLNEMVNSNHPFIQSLADKATQADAWVQSGAKSLDLSHLHGDALRSYMDTLSPDSPYIDLSVLDDEQRKIVLFR
jgi:hypothetical protein